LWKNGNDQEMYTTRKAGTRGTLTSDLHAGKATAPCGARDRAMLRCDAGSSRSCNDSMQRVHRNAAQPRIMRCSKPSPRRRLLKPIPE